MKKLLHLRLLSVILLMLCGLRGGIAWAQENLTPIYKATFDEEGDTHQTGTNSYSDHTYTASDVEWTISYSEVCNPSAAIDGYSCIGRVAKNTTNSPVMQTAAISTQNKTVKKVEFKLKGNANIDVAIYISTNGTSWGTAIGTFTAATTASTKSISNLNIESENIYLKFVGTVASANKSSNRDFAIDDVTVYAEDGTVAPAPTLQYSESFYELFIDATPSFPTLTAKQADGTTDISLEDIVFTSSNIAVATINNNGEIALIGNGETTIKAEYMDDNLDIYEASYILNVKLHKAQKFGWYDTENNKVEVLEVEKDATGVALPTFSAASQFTYIFESNDEDIATVSEEGAISLNTSNVGTVTLTAMGSRLYYEDEVATLTITVTKINPTFILSGESSYTIDINDNDNFDMPTLDTNTDATISWTSSNPDVATVNQEGFVEFVGTGTTVITASAPETDNFNSASASYTLTIVDYANSYVLVTDANQLQAGDSILIVGYGWNKNGQMISVMSNLNSDGIFTTVDIESTTVAQATSKLALPAAITAPTGALELILEAKDVYWNFTDGENYIQTNSDKNKASFASYVADNCNATISIAEGDDPIASVQFPNGGTYNVFDYNFNDAMNSNGRNTARFGTYSAVQNSGNLYIYRKPAAAKEYETVSVADKATFCSDKALDFTQVAGVKAYVATTVGETSVALEEVTGAVPAGTGLILIAKEGGEFEVPVVATATAPADNLLKASFKGSDIPCTDATATRYVFGKKSNDTEKAFHRLVNNPMANNTGNLAYLEAPASASSAPRLSIIVDGEETGIEDIEVAAASEGTAYNLSGQKVSAQYKGIVIKNGKKVLKK